MYEEEKIDYTNSGKEQPNLLKNVLLTVSLLKEVVSTRYTVNLFLQYLIYALNNVSLLKLCTLSAFNSSKQCQPSPVVVRCQPLISS